MSADVVFISTDEGDWEGMYLNGELKYEGHSLSVDQVLEVLGISSIGYEVDEEFMSRHGYSCPKILPNDMSDYTL